MNPLLILIDKHDVLNIRNFYVLIIVGRHFVREH